jgi:hypothetical protein
VRLRLYDTNPYLRDSALRERMVFKSVASSSAIEGIQAPFRDMAQKKNGKSAPDREIKLNGNSRSHRFKP